MAIGGSTTIRYYEGGSLISLERDLLREHDVVDRKIALGREAPTSDMGAALIELLDVQLCTTVDAITLPGI